ncbi:MAG: hypothetical protein IPI79_15615 [Moraxellaceae bacterium]|nr:hypothetical protein [Moraxellaceae bacterium]
MKSQIENCCINHLDLDNNLDLVHNLPPQQNSSSAKADFFSLDLHPDFCDMVSDTTPQAQNTVDHFAETKITTKSAELPSTPKLEIQEQVKKALTVLDIIRLLKDIHPVFSRDWQDKIPNLLDKLDEDSRRRAYKTILEPKNIIVTPDNKLVFSGRLTLADAKKVLVSRPISAAIDKLLRIVSNITQTRNILAIADSLEAGIELINNINAEDNFALQKEKLRLAEVFLYDFAIELREHDFDPPPSERGLTVDIIKTYIIEVLLKKRFLAIGLARHQYVNYKKTHFCLLKQHYLMKLKYADLPLYQQSVISSSLVRSLNLNKTLTPFVVFC